MNAICFLPRCQHSSLAAIPLAINLRASISGFKKGLKAFESYNTLFQETCCGGLDAMIIRLRLYWQYEQWHVATALPYYHQVCQDTIDLFCDYGILHDSYSCSTGIQADAVMCISCLLLLGRYRTFIGTKSDVPSSMWDNCARAK